jgi:CBS-domain-containing membrane protein
MKVLDLMTPKTVTVKSDDSVLSAIRLMLDNEVSGLPVVDESYKLVGMVTESDLLRRAELETEKHQSWWHALLASPGKLAAEYAQTHAHRVRDVMTSPVHTVDFDTPIFVAVDIMEKFRIKRLPVVRGTTLVGILSRRDLLKAAYWLIAEPLDTAHSQVSDQAITNSLSKEIQAQPWTSEKCITTRVNNGVVELCGVIFDERARSALRILAEGVPGVTEIRDHLVCIEPNSGFVITPSTSADANN